ncbi:MAG: hypothetical protein IJ783_01150, partial [Kiritimatiellae bacterium]|nr:hypothetical protein [Kiritimatiellia bacterium]
MKLCLPAVLSLSLPLASAAAFAARPSDPWDGLPVVEPAATNLAVQLLLPDCVAPGETAVGRVAWSNLLSGAVVEAPAFTVEAAGGVRFAGDAASLPLAAASPVGPNSSGEAAFEFAADAANRLTLRMADSGAP